MINFLKILNLVIRKEIEIKIDVIIEIKKEIGRGIALK